MGTEKMKDLFTALSKAQRSIKGATKDSTNPHFKSKYADLASVWDAVREPLADNGLTVTQIMETTADGAVNMITVLAHSSGDEIRSTYPLKPVQDTPQGWGSAITYARRYCLAAICGVCPEDDDGAAATTGTAKPYVRPEGVKSSAALKREVDFPAIIAELHECQSEGEVNMWSRKHAATFASFPPAWTTALNEKIDAHLVNLQEVLERSAK